MPELFTDLYDAHLAALVRLRAMGRVFLVGCAKSGTTWLMHMLNGHPAIVASGEGAFAWRLGPLVLQAFKAFNDGRRQDATYLRDADQMLALRALFDARLLRYIEASGREPASVRIVGDKTPQHTVGMPLLAALYPESKFVHIVRDPRDAATSALFHLARSDPRPRDEYIRYFITTVWPLNAGSARQAGSRLPGRYLEIRYEDLLADEAGEARRVLMFLGVASDNAAVEACRSAARFERFTGGRPRGEVDASSFFRRGVAGDWVNHLPDDLARDCCRQIAPLMAEFGYGVDETPSPCRPPGPVAADVKLESEGVSAGAAC